MENKTKKITDEVTSRLEDLFGETHTEPDPVDSQPVEVEQQHSSLEDLNAIILSIEWEISDEIMNRFISEIGVLKKEFKDDKIISSFLQLQGSIGQYINKNKANAHPESIKLLHSIHVNLENIATSPMMPEPEKKAILAGEIKQYKDLKKQISIAMHGKKPTVSTSPQKEILQKPSKTEQKPHTTGPGVTGEEKPALDNEMAAHILEEIRKVIREEFKLLKDEILSWKQT